MERQSQTGLICMSSFYELVEHATRKIVIILQSPTAGERGFDPQESYARLLFWLSLTKRKPKTMPTTRSPTVNRIEGIAMAYSFGRKN